MGVIKTQALALIVAIAGLMILQLPGSIREATTISDLSAIKHESATVARQQPPTQPEQARAEAPESNLSKPNAYESPAAATVVPQPIDWMRILYPELVRIAELENQPADEALVELLPMLNDANSAVRVAAIETIGDMTMPSVLPVLTTALSDADPQVRIVALEALSVHEAQAAVGSIERYLYDEDPEVRQAAIEALSDLEGESAVHSLAGLLFDAEAPIRRQAVNALGDIGGENAVMYLLQARYDPEPGIRTIVENILLELEYSNY